MKNKEFFEALKLMEKEKGIRAEFLAEKIANAIVVAERRDYDGLDIVHCDIDTEKENTFFIMESRYYKIKISDEEFSKIKNVGQDLDDYEKDLNFKFEFVSVKDAYEKNKSLLVCSDGETVNFWVERETLVLEKTVGTTGMLWQVAKVYTMPDGQPGLKLQRVQ